MSEHIELLAKDDDAKRIAKGMASLELCGTLQNPGAVFRKKELVYRILCLAYEDKVILSAEQKYPQIFEGALLLEQSFLENLPISRFAKASNISLSLFRQLFRKQYGVSPVQYRNRLRIQKAKAYLSEGSCTVSEAAYACGFENVGYFCRCYKKITSETPQETKKKNG